MITGIRLQNFRGFQQAEIALKPLTVLLGPNSAGKSSFLHALVGLAQYHRLPGGPSQTPNLQITAGYNESIWPVDLGSYETLVHQGSQTEPVTISLSNEDGTVEFGFGGKYQGGESANELVLTRIHLQEPTVVQVAGTSAPIAEPAEIEVPSIATGSAIESEPLHPATSFDAVVGDKWTSIFGPTHVRFSGLNLVDASLAQTGSKIHYPTSVLVNLMYDINKIIYLMPCRERPKRKFDHSENRSSDSAPLCPSGEWVASILRYDAEDKKKEKQEIVTVCEPPGIPDSITGDYNPKEWTKSEKSISAAVAYWLQRFELALEIEATGDAHHTMLKAVMVGEAVCDLPDVGFGLSQLLPIVVAGLTLPNGGILVVEQPESQLHPKAQSVLGDFFCSLIKNRRQVLVETHSEALIDRLRLLVAMDLQLQESIAVQLIDQPCGGQCSEPRELKLNEEGEMDWPAGFMMTGVEEEVRIGFIRDQQVARKES